MTLGFQPLSASPISDFGAVVVPSQGRGGRVGGRIRAIIQVLAEQERLKRSKVRQDILASKVRLKQAELYAEKVIKQKTLEVAAYTVLLAEL